MCVNCLFLSSTCLPGFPVALASFSCMVRVDIVQTGSLFYMNWESCERTCQDPRKRGRRDDGFLPTALKASDHDVEDTSSETLVDQSTSDYSFGDTLGSAQTEEASLMSSS